MIRVPMVIGADSVQLECNAILHDILVAVAPASLCEFVWVLRRVYGFTPADVATAIRALLDAANTKTNRPAAEVGVAVLEAGGDFADGVIALEGQWLGGETFVSFDKPAIALLTAQGQSASLLAQ